MSDVIVQGIFLLAATGLGGALGFLSSRSGAEISKLREQNTHRSAQIRKFLQQIEAYHLLEDLYASDLAGLSGRQLARSRYKVNQGGQNHQN